MKLGAHCAPCWWHVMLADLETKGIGADTLAVELSEVCWPHLCEWECEAFMTRTHWQCAMWSHARAACGKAIGLFKVVHDVCIENGVTLDSWHPRVRMAFPYLCRHDCELVANWMTRP